MSMQGDIVKYLIEHGANIHANNDAALGTSAAAGHLSIVKYLVEHGANIHANNDYALRITTEHGHSEIATYLMINDTDTYKNSNNASSQTDNSLLNILKCLWEQCVKILKEIFK